MTIQMYVGMVTGIIVACLAVLLGQRAQRRTEQADAERSKMAKTSSFVLTACGIIAFAGWVADNLLAYSHGEAIRVITPWSLILLAVVAVGVALQVIGQRNRSPKSRKELTWKEIGPVLLMDAATVPSFFIMRAQGIYSDQGLETLMLILIAAMLAGTCWMLGQLREVREAFLGSHK